MEFDMGQHRAGLSRKDLIKTLLKDGWYEVKGKGDHSNFKHPTKIGKVTVPCRITRNIEKSVLAQAGLRRNTYRESMAHIYKKRV